MVMFLVQCCDNKIVIVLICYRCPSNISVVPSVSLTNDCYQVIDRRLPVE